MFFLVFLELFCCCVWLRFLLRSLRCFFGDSRLLPEGCLCAWERFVSIGCGFLCVGVVFKVAGHSGLTCCLWYFQRRSIGLWRHQCVYPVISLTSAGACLRSRF